MQDKMEMVLNKHCSINYHPGETFQNNSSKSIHQSGAVYGLTDGDKKENRKF
jgi:hypothetical protein